MDEILSHFVPWLSQLCTDCKNGNLSRKQKVLLTVAIPLLIMKIQFMTQPAIMQDSYFVYFLTSYTLWFFCLNYLLLKTWCHKNDTFKLRYMFIQKRAWSENIVMAVVSIRHTFTYTPRKICIDNKTRRLPPRHTAAVSTKFTMRRSNSGRWVGGWVEGDLM